VLKFVVIIFISLSYFKSQTFMKIMRKNLIGRVNIHISTIVLLNAGTVPTVWYIFFHFIIGYKKNSWVAIAEQKIWLWSSSVIEIVKMKYNRIDIKWRLVLTSFNKGNNKITELRTILQRESQTSYVYKQTKSVHNWKIVKTIMTLTWYRHFYVESDFKAPNLPLSLRLKGSSCHYYSIYNNTGTK
jgi:hypothetical protein